MVEREVIGVVLDVLASYGLRGDDALHAVRGLRSVIHGFATLETREGLGSRKWWAKASSGRSEYSSMA